MILYPAIDISEGKAVRLRQGDFDEKTVYRDDPLEAARAWVDAGARFLHVVDLDGAQGGAAAEPRAPRAHHARARRARSSTAAACGRCRPCATRCAPGRQRVILGTAAFNDIDFLDDVVARLRRARGRLGRHARRQRLDVGLAGDHADAGRRRDPAAPAARRAAVRLHERRQATGCSRASTSTRCAGSPSVVRGRFLYSGGIGSLDDLEGLAALRQVNLAGVIVGKALYEGRFTVEEGAGAPWTR